MRSPSASSSSLRTVRPSCLKTGPSGATTSRRRDPSSSRSSSTTTTDATSATSTTTGAVSWGSLHIQTYPNILGDNPGVTEGCPIALGWKPIKSESHDSVLVYEDTVRKSRPRRRRKDLVMKSAERDTYLLGQGYKLVDLIEMAEETKKIRQQRQASMKGTKWDTFKSVFQKGVFSNLLKDVATINLGDAGASSSASSSGSKPKTLVSRAG